ncbi:MAG TPA: Gfo/Idh/MocA family oxidoreductase [Solirubrobacterales bacterium]|nr:Gfo/Idh/MocA family oxidoreductase [Solirubrobacterales bacterium]
MRLGIAGCGRIAERGYVPAALAVAGVTIAAFADPDADRLRQCGETWERESGEAAQTFASASELLRDAPVDLLVVAAPVAHHLALAEEAAAAGVPSLVEKPPAPDLTTTERLAALDPQPYLAFNRRFLQGAELRNRIPAEGWLELDLELRFRRGDWGAHEADDEALLDAGIHLIDLACHLTDSAPIAVRQADITPERATFELELTRARARISCATDRSHREAIAIRDRAGKSLASTNWGGIGARLSPLLGRPDPLVLSLQRQLEALRDSDPQLHHPLHPAEGGGGAVGGRRRAMQLASAAEGIAAMAVVEAARRSAELGGAEVTVEPVAETAQ